MKQKQSASTPRLLKLLFIISIALFYVSQTAYSLYILLQASSSSSAVNGDFMTSNVISMGFALAPIVVWLVVHITRRDRSFSVSSVFESMLLTASAMIIMVGLGMWTTLIGFLPFVSSFQTLWLWTLISGVVPLIVVVCGLMLVIFYLRRKKQW